MLYTVLSTVLVVPDRGVATVPAEGTGVSGCTNLAKASGQLCGRAYITVLYYNSNS